MTCIRCGSCCEYEWENEIKICKHLRYQIDGKTYCPIYSHRIGTILDQKIIMKLENNKNLVKAIVCGFRKDDKRIIPGCTEK